MPSFLPFLMLALDYVSKCLQCMNLYNLNQGSTWEHSHFQFADQYTALNSMWATSALDFLNTPFKNN
jgi:hypothetical protein